jgi:hypothetical protein
MDFMDSLNLPPCCLAAPTSLKIDAGISREDFQKIGAALRNIDVGADLWQCDLAVYAVKRWDDEGLLMASAALGMSVYYLKKQFLRVAMAFPPERRNSRFGKTHYITLLPFAAESGFDEWLASVADRPNLSARSLKVLAQERFGVGDTKPPKKRTIDLGEHLWTSLAPHATGKNVSELVKAICVSWLESAPTPEKVSEEKQTYEQHRRHQKYEEQKAKGLVGKFEADFPNYQEPKFPEFADA